MKKIILIISLFVICASLSGCNERDLPLVDETIIQVGNFSGESLVSGELIGSGEKEAVEISLKMIETYGYEEDDEFAQLHGEGIEKYQVFGLKDEKEQKIINDKLLSLYEETVKEYEEHVSEDYLPSLKIFVIIENDDFLSFGVSRKWLTTNETSMKEYYTINKKTADLMELSDFYDNKVGFLSAISKQIHDEFEIRKEQLKTDFEIDDSYFFNLTEEDFYDKILLDQGSFYISENAELVYYFQKYEIGPGVIGDQEFVLIENVEL